MKMDVRYLTYIIEIAEQMNMTKASKKLYVSQSSLSQYLSKLETELGTPLFTRVNNELRITQAGKMYVEAAKKVVDIQNELYQNIFSLSNTGSISVAITSHWSLSMMSDLVSVFKERFPNVTLEIIEDNVMPVIGMVHMEKVDFALISITDIKEFKDHSELLQKEEVIFAVPNNHSFCLKHKKNSYQLPQMDIQKIFKYDSFILSKKGTPVRFIADDILEKNNFVPDPIFEMNSMHVVRNMVSKGVGVAFIPSSCAEYHPDVTYFSFTPKVYRHNIFAMRKHLLLNKPEKYLMELFRNYQFPNNT